MHPAFSVIFLTTLIGAGQGFFLALYTEQVYSAVGLLPPQPGGYYTLGSAMALADCAGAIMLFDVLDRDGNLVGTYKIIHGEFFRHDGWALGPGTFTPLGGDSQQAAAAADHITVHQIECTRRR